jgi:hypothetical protein
MRVLSPRIEPPETDDEGSHGQHGDALSPFDQIHPERLDEGRFAGTGSARDADPNGPSGVRQQCRQHLPRTPLVVAVRRLDEGDGLGQRPAATAQDAVHEALVGSRQAAGGGTGHIHALP